MSFIAGQMERRNSSQSTLSRGGSEMGSRYLSESGIYMTSFAATVFVAALVTVGILLVTLLVALTVMLESCQSKRNEFMETVKTTNDYEYCKTFSVHAELNNLGADECPTICKAFAIDYVNGGHYWHDLNLTMQLAENYFNTLAPAVNGLDILLIDIDDIFPPNVPNYSNVLHHRVNLVDDVIYPIHMLVLRLHKKLHAKGWSLILFSRKPEKERNSTIENLNSSGYSGWSSLIMRSDEELAMPSWEYIAGRREKLHQCGFRIISVFSSQIDALTGPSLGTRNFKLPYPIYYRIHQQMKDM